MKKSEFIIFSDGACSGNPGPGGWASIIANYGTDSVIEIAGAAENTTNNRMELLATIEALVNVKTAGSAAPITLYTDSKYVINGITKWIHGWKKNGYISSQGGAVANQDLWEKLDVLANGSGLKIKWLYVPGHSGIEGNERVDELAVQARNGDSMLLYKGPLTSYMVNLEVSPTRLEDIKNFKAFYMSYVEGELELHDTWTECEKRVKGKKGAKFKKVSTPQEEQETLKSWGLI